MAAQQANMGAQNAANRAVFVADCLNAGNSADVCNARTYGQTPVGGYTSDAFVQGPQLLQDAAGNFVAWPGSAAGGSGGSTGGGASVFTFTNLTSGDNSNFKVGDRWQIQISGAAPNAPVSVNGGMNGANALTPMGSTDASGNYTRNGQMSQAEVGSWQETWRVNNQILNTFTFKVSPAGTAAGGTGTGGGQSTQTTSSITKSVFGTLPGGSVSIGGMNIPVWGLGLAAVALFFMMRGK